MLGKGRREVEDERAGRLGGAASARLLRYSKAPDNARADGRNAIGRGWAGVQGRGLGLGEVSQSGLAKGGTQSPASV